MAGIKITNFLGIAPKTASELLPDTAAQVARNCKLDSGNLIPYPRPVRVDGASRNNIRTLYGLRNPSTGAPTWLSWTTDVNVAVATDNKDQNQRFYFTGDGVPKVSDYSLATESAPPYPNMAYDLGLPLPEGYNLLPTVNTFTTKTVSTYARDAGNIATIVTTAAHGLRTGNSITVSGFTYRTGTYSQSGTTAITVTITNHGLSNGATVTLDFTSGTAIDGTFTISGVTTNTFTVTANAAATTSGNVGLDVRGFNATSVECTVINSTTFTYFSPGFQLTTTTASNEKVDLAGITQNRTYVWTWLTPWLEESIASEPTPDLYIRDGQIVNLAGGFSLPIGPPSVFGVTRTNFIEGIRVYRAVASSSGTEYYRLTTIWFPAPIKSGQRTNNVTRITLARPHNLGIGDKFKIPSGTFAVSVGTVSNIVDAYIFEFAQTGADVAPINWDPVTQTGVGTLQFEIGSTAANTDRFWGYAAPPLFLPDYSFVDDYDSRILDIALETDEYDAPPDNLQGLVAIQNNVLAGFVANEIYFSEPNKPHAWPVSYKVTIEPNIVGLAAVNGALLVLTESYPYVISGADPAAGYSTQRIDLRYACVSAKSIVNMLGGVFWASHDGLAFYSSLGSAVLTKFNYNNDTWNTDLVPSTITATSYGDVYLASHSTGSFTFERDEKVGGLFVSLDEKFAATWYDSVDNKIYFTTSANEDIYEWDNLAQLPLTQQWKSKTFKTKDPINMGAARVIADYSGSVVNPLVTPWNNMTANWESITEVYGPSSPLTFKLYVDKVLVFTRGVDNSRMFRLPNGYRSDTFEFEIETFLRLREVQMAETSTGLEEL